MAFYTDGVVPWNSLDDNTRAPLSSELEGGYPCGEADHELFNWTAGWPIGNIWNVLLSAGLTPDSDKLLDLARAIQSQKLNFAVAGGTGNALTVALVPARTTLTDGLSILVKITTLNTGPATLSVNGLAPVSITTASGQPLKQGDLPTNAFVRMNYSSSTNAFQVEGLGGGATYQASGAQFSAPGVTNWTCPEGVFRVRARVWGAGGGGGGGFSNTSSPGAGAGGTGGGYAEGYFNVIPENVYPVTVGSPGAGGSSPLNGTAGGSSSFSSFISATGGSGGLGGNNTSTGPTGSPGTGTGGYISVPGNFGAGGGTILGSSVTIAGGGGGAFGSSNSYAVNNSSPGVFPGGGGGGGAVPANGGGVTGGNGATGFVILEW